MFSGELRLDFGRDEFFADEEEGVEVGGDSGALGGGCRIPVGEDTSENVGCGVYAEGFESMG